MGIDDVRKEQLRDQDRRGQNLRGCVYEGHGFEGVVDQDGVVEGLVRVLDCV